jgi:hypothetical protein
MNHNFFKISLLIGTLIITAACSKQMELSQSSTSTFTNDIGLGHYNAGASRSVNDNNDKDKFAVYAITDSKVATLSGSSSEPNSLKQTTAFGEVFLAYLNDPNQGKKTLKISRCAYKNKNNKVLFYSLTLTDCNNSEANATYTPELQGSGWIYTDERTAKKVLGETTEVLPLYVYSQDVSKHTVLKTVKTKIYMLGTNKSDTLTVSGLKFDLLKNSDPSKSPVILGYVEKYTNTGAKKRTGKRTMGVLARRVGTINESGWHFGFKHQKYLTRMPNLDDRVANLFSYKNIQINGQYTHGLYQSCSNCNSYGTSFVNALTEVNHSLYKVAFMFRDPKSQSIDTIVFERAKYDRSNTNFDVVVNNEMRSVKLTVNGQARSNQISGHEETLKSGYVLHWEVVKSSNLISYYRLLISAPKSEDGKYDPAYEFERFVIEPSREFRMIQGGTIKAEPGFNLSIATSEYGIEPESTLPNGTIGVSARWNGEDGADIFKPVEMAYAPQGGGVLETANGNGANIVLSRLDDQYSFRSFYLTNNLTDTRFTHFTNCFESCPGQKAKEIMSNDEYYKKLYGFISDGTDNIGIKNNGVDSQFIYEFNRYQLKPSVTESDFLSQMSTNYDGRHKFLGKVFNYYSDPTEDLEITISKGWGEFVDPRLNDFIKIDTTDDLINIYKTEHFGLRIGNNHIVNYRFNFATLVNGQAYNLNSPRQIKFGNGFTYEQHMQEQTEDVWILFPEHSKYFGIHFQKHHLLRVVFRESRNMPNNATGLFASQFAGTAAKKGLEANELKTMFSK